MLQLDQIERQVMTDRTAAAALRAGGFEVELPTFAEQRAAFDEWLNSDPKPVVVEQSEQMELKRALGVA